jgi:hypothetical protein
MFPNSVLCRKVIEGSFQKAPVLEIIPGADGDAPASLEEVLARLAEARVNMIM